MIDTTVLIAIITGVLGLLTLAIQSWLALEMAKLKTGQAQAAVVRQEQSDKLDEVHAAVVSTPTSPDKQTMQGFPPPKSPDRPIERGRNG